MKQRLDQALVDWGLARSRSQARDLIKRGCVKVGGRTAAKAGLAVTAPADVEVEAGAQPWVSRAGLKLVAALDAFGFAPDGHIALDVGASTGGFTHVLIERGARHVYAVDVGRHQLDPLLCADPRVTNLEGRDARTLTSADVSGRIGAIAADLSFVSLTKVLAPALGLAHPGAWLIALIKPQFEVGRQNVGKGGIVRSDSARDFAVAEVRAWLDDQPGWHVCGLAPSPIAGGSGNREFLIGAQFDG